MLVNLSGKVAIVTGGPRGIGRGIAVQLARAGARVVVGYHQNRAAAEAVQLEIERAGGEAALVQGSVADDKVAAGLVAEAIGRFGRLDVLVNNAGVLLRQFAMLIKPDSWRAALDVNLTGAFFCAQAALPAFVEQRSGSIINIASVVTVRGLPGQVCYASAKAGLLGMSRTLAKEVARYGVRVNSIAPGYVATDMLSEQEIKEAASLVPLKSLGTPDDVAHMAVFLATDHARYITGQTMVVDGGLSL
jgi:3-oxoacyl-[acyl-carrier protein] reductase